VETTSYFNLPTRSFFFPLSFGIVSPPEEDEIAPCSDPNSRYLREPHHFPPRSTRPEDPSAFRLCRCIAGAALPSVDLNVSVYSLATMGSIEKKVYTADDQCWYGIRIGGRRSLSGLAPWGLRC
jgi:hypothetical protein